MDIKVSDGKIYRGKEIMTKMTFAPSLIVYIFFIMNYNKVSYVHLGFVINI